ncbi:MAG: hypothetical protein M1816_006792 [Peltula sp. TS41687]|nr:MAG: hypothetical protein M1816_006792 [Peltula sp. TS41687]
MEVVDRAQRTKRKRKRKLRTQFSPSPPPPEAVKSQDEQGGAQTDTREAAPAAATNHSTQESRDITGHNPDDVHQAPSRKPNDEQIREAFQSYYLRKITAELSDELDSLRSAQDFTDASLPMLMAALKQGVDCFSMVEQKAVVEAESSAGGEGK